MWPLNNVAMTETEYNRIHASRYHYWLWVAKFYLTHPGCLWRDLWWAWMPGKVIKFNSFVGWSRSDLEQWCWDNIGIKNISWSLRIDDWIKGESYTFYIKVRIGKTKYLSQLTLIVR